MYALGHLSHLYSLGLLDRRPKNKLKENVNKNPRISRFFAEGATRGLVSNYDVNYLIKRAVKSTDACNPGKARRPEYHNGVRDPNGAWEPQ